jgi:hypothetical protein
MNPFSVPPLICAVLFFFLGIAVVLYNPRAKPNIILAILSFTWALFALSVFMFHLAEELPEALFWDRWPYGLLLPSVIIAVYYSIVLNNLDTKWKKRILHLSVKAHFLIFGGLAIFFWLN